jgi:hypothetical protein
MKVLSWMIQLFSGCHHRELSRVFTIQSRTYQVCLDCGRKIDYSWELMRSLEPRPAANRLALRESRSRVQDSIT